MKKYLTLPVILLIGILLIASFFRLHMIEAYLTFLGDEGRDVLVALNILRGDFTLLGPRASAGDFFHGPIYYYMITPFLFLANYNPVGPAIMIALIGIATVGLVYLVAKRFFGVYPALAASALYAVAPLVVEYSRSSWNPNPMPFVTLLTLFLLYLGVKEGSWKKMVLVGILLGIALQLHYISVFVAIIVAVFVIVGNMIVKKKLIPELRRMIFEYFEIFSGFLIGFSPFLAFEIRHNFPNIRTIFAFIFRSALGEEFEGAQRSFGDIVSSVSFRFFGRILTAFPQDNTLEWYTDQQVAIWSVFTVSTGAALTIAIFLVKNKLQKALLFTWLILGIVLFGFYKKPIYDYYLGFLYPLPFLLLANFFHVLTHKKIPYITKKIGIVISVIVFSLLMFTNLVYTPFERTPNFQKDQMRQIAEFVLEKSNGQPYNFALVSEGNTDHAYRYFLELANHPPQEIQNQIIDPQRDSVTNQLFVVCEQECQPLGNALWEIAGYGRAEIAEEWNVSVSRVYKLVTYTGPIEENTELRTQ